MQPFFGENIRNRQPKSHFEAFQSEKYPRFHGGKLAPARDPALREPKAGVTIAKSAVVPVATWLRHPLRLDALSRTAARASHGG